VILQGGAVALYTALTHEEQLGGVLALSTWLPLHQLFKNVSSFIQLFVKMISIIFYRN